MRPSVIDTIAWLREQPNASTTAPLVDLPPERIRALQWVHRCGLVAMVGEGLGLRCEVRPAHVERLERAVRAAHAYLRVQDPTYPEADPEGWAHDTELLITDWLLDPPTGVVRLEREIRERQAALAILTEES